ncbi:MAG: Pup--protein ligase [Nitriliruptoraceae bacterium]
MRRRIFGLETEFGVTWTDGGQRRLSPDEVARELFRRVVSWGRSSNVFLDNGARLYLDVGSHPEYATPECDSPWQVTVHDRAGEHRLAELALAAQARLHEDGVAGRIAVFKNNTDSAGNSYGCHENYLVERTGEFQRFAEALLPFLITRQVFAGAGKVLATPRGTIYALAQRAEHIWEGVSSATTRSRPIINTRDEPHADADRFRRLHVIVGDSNMSPYTTWLKVATCDLVLRLLERRSVLRELALENPIRAIRDISHDLTGTRRVPLASGRAMSALEIQRTYLEQVERFVAADPERDDEDERVVAAWRDVLDRLERDPASLGRRLDWVAKLQLIESYQAKHDLTLSDPRVALLDLAYHDVLPERGLFRVLERQGRTEVVLDPAAVDQARTQPPATTRAALRGRFIQAAKARRRDYTVDWVHLKLNDQAQRTVLCTDPFRAQDERVDRLIASM